MNKHLTIYDQFKQNTPPWEFVRLGLVTGSEFNLLLRTGRGGKGESLTRRRRIFDCAHELIAGERADTWSGNRFTERGHALEADALELYLDAYQQGETVTRPAFIRDNRLRTGVSPDALIGEDGGVEIKTMAGGMFLDLMEDPRVPPEHIPQLQAMLLVTGRSWWDLMIYSPPHPPFVARVVPDPDYHMQLRTALASFNKEVERIVLKNKHETVKTCQDRLDARLEEVIAEWREALAQAFDPGEEAIAMINSQGVRGE